MQSLSKKNKTENSDDIVNTSEEEDNENASEEEDENASDSEKKTKQKHVKNDESSDNENEEGEEEVEKKHHRYFKLIDDKTGKSRGRYTGDTPKQAASKAFTKMLQKLKTENKKLPKESIIYLREATRNSPKKIYGYEAVRVKLEVAQHLEIEDAITGKTKVIVYQYRNKIKKVPVPDQIGGVKISKLSKKAGSKTKTSSKNKKAGSKSKTTSTNKKINKTSKKESSGHSKTNKKNTSPKKNTPLKKNKPVSKKNKAVSKKNNNAKASATR